MVTEKQRRFVRWMIRLRLWRGYGWLRIVWIEARWGTRWLLRRLVARQIVDIYHHAPCCPANHYHRTRLVFQSCTCGAVAARVL